MKTEASVCLILVTLFIAFALPRIVFSAAAGSHATYGSSSKGYNASSVQPSNRYFAISDSAAIYETPTIDNGTAIRITELEFNFTPVGGNATDTIIFVQGYLSPLNEWQGTILNGTSTDSGALIPSYPIISYRQSDGYYNVTIRIACAEADGFIVLYFQQYGESVLIGIKESTYSVSFTESGLPSGTEWWVDLNADNESSTSTVIDFSMPNGTYTCSTGASGYNASPSQESVKVNGTNMSEPVIFSVVPEFPSIVILPFFMMATLLTVAICRKRRISKRAKI